MAQELGTGYIIIKPSTKGLGKAIEGSIGEGTQAGVKASGSTILSSVGGAFKTVGKVGVAAVGAVGGAIVGLAAKGGFDRALNIERAQTKLKALGHDTKSVDGIMADALKSVKGTAYGLGDAASVAASLVASGVRQGDELAGVLTTVGDVAQVSGRSFQDMGIIFQQVAAKGKLQGDEMLQLMESGIPVLQYLADHFGVTAAEAQQMVSDGKVSFADFEAAMREHLGGAAQSAGESFDGAMGNIKAALSRLGETAVTPVIKGLTSLFNQAIPIIDDFTAQAKPVLEDVGKALQTGLENAIPAAQKALDELRANPSLQRMGDAAKTLYDGLVELGDGFVDLATNQQVVDTFGHAVETSLKAIADVAEPVAKYVSDTFKAMGDGLEQLSKSDTFSQFLDWMQWAQDACGDLYEALGDLIGALGELFGTDGSQWAATFELYLKRVMLVLTPLVLAVKAVAWVFERWSDTIRWIGDRFEELQQRLQPVVDWFSTTFDAIGTGLQNLHDYFIVPILDAIGAKAQAVYDTYIAPVADWVKGKADEIGAKLTELRDAYVTPILDAIGAKVQAVYDTYVAPVVDWVKGKIDEARAKIQEFKDAVGPILDQVAALFSSDAATAQAAWQQVTDFLASIPGRIVGFFASIGGRIAQPFRQGADAARSAWDGVAGFFASIPGRIVGFFAGAGSWLVASGQAILQGLIDGLNSMVGAAMSAAERAVSAIREFFPFSPAKRGPFSGRGWTLYSGRSIMAAMADGMRDERHGVATTMDTIMADVRKRASAPLTASLSLDGPGGTEFSALSPSWGVPALAAAPVLAASDGGVRTYNITLNGAQVSSDARLARLLDELVDSLGVSLKARW